MRTLAAWLVVAAAVAAPLRGQVPSQPDVLRIGAPIRVTTSDFAGAPIVGVFAGTVGDTILVGVPGGSDALRLPRRNISRVETQVGRRSAAATGAVIGMLAGAGIGGIIAVAAQKNGLGPTDAGLFMGGGALGAIVGGVVAGSVFTAPRWVVVPLELVSEPVER